MSLRLADDFEDGAGDDSRGSFRSDHRTHQVIAAAFFGRSAQFDDFSIGEHQGNAENMVGGDPVLEGMRTARIFRDITADGASLLRRWIWRIEEAVAFHRIGNVQIYHAALDLHPPI